MQSRPIDILWVEDSVTDITLVRQALKDSNILHNLHFVYDGIQALEYLRNDGAFITEPIPDLIVLDLNMPRKNGLEVLQEIKNDPKLKLIPVLILSTSTSEDDILASYALNANCFISKPFEYDQFVSIIKNIEQFWLSNAKLPHII
jgi:chemotaxis family two-component system response regulator Rcp1